MSEWENPYSLANTKYRGNFLLDPRQPGATGLPSQPQGPKRLTDAEYMELDPVEKIQYARTFDQTQYENRWPEPSGHEPKFWPDGFSEEKALASRNLDRYGRRVDR